MWMRFKDLWWIKKGKWSTGFLENGTKAFTAASHLLPNASGGQVGTVFDNEQFDKGMEVISVDKLFVTFLFPFRCRLHAHGLRTVLWLHQVRHWTEWALPRVERCSAPHRCPIQAWSKVQHPTLSYKYAAATEYKKNCYWFPTNKITSSVTLLVSFWRVQTEYLSMCYCWNCMSIWFSVCLYWKVMLGSHRHLEEGNLEMASSEKQRIEDLQRTRRKWKEENDTKQEPRFFK